MIGKWDTNTMLYSDVFTTHPHDYATLYERHEEIRRFTDVRYWLATPQWRNARTTDLSWFNILMSKKIDSQDRTITKKQRFEEDLQNLIDGPIVEDLSEETNIIEQQIEAESKLKFLQMYFDCYMAPKMSDQVWRLGPITGTVLDTAKTDELGTIVNGEMYTRSNFAIPYIREFIDNNRLSSKKEFYTTMFFPPYKMGAHSPLDGETYYMNALKEKQPNIPFNHDTFMLKKEGFTYRDPGFKAINDNIIFLQWLAEGVTGVVSTYLTEWDLSLYMQEHMMSPMPNGGPVKLYINYRIKEDNPLADVDQIYKTDRALVFNTLGSAVSKIHFDCQKIWRPSDYPLSTWWLPYVEGRDFNLTYFEYYNNRLCMDIKIPYMDLYDKFDPHFNNDGQSDIRGIFKNEDFKGAIFGCWRAFTLPYYNIFYSTDSDSLTEYEILANNMMKSAQGADLGRATASKVGAKDFALAAKVEMLASGGMTGKSEPAGQGGADRENIKAALGMGFDDPGMPTIVMNGLYPIAGINLTVAAPYPVAAAGMPAGLLYVPLGKETLKRGDSSGSGPMTPMDAAYAAADSAAGGPFEELLGPQAGTSPLVTDFLSSGLNQKPDASQMTKSTGVNKFSPPLYGGPHGADFSPNTIQSWFQLDSKYFRNIPRISYENCNYFKSKDYYDTIKDANQFYHHDDESKKSNTFHDGLKKLVQGINTYSIDYITRMTTKTEWVKGNITYCRYCGRFTHGGGYNFPATTSQGYRYSYTGDYEYRQRQYSYSNNPWSYYSWYYNYYSYYNYYNYYYYGWYGGYYRWNVVTYDIYRKASYTAITLEPYKKYHFEDMPEAKWSIVQHQFGETDVSMFAWGRNWWGGYYGSGFWGWTRNVYNHYNIWRRGSNIYNYSNPYHSNYYYNYYYYNNYYGQRYNYNHWNNYYSSNRWYGNNYYYGGYYPTEQEVKKKNVYVLKFFGDDKLEKKFINKMLNGYNDGNSEKGKAEIPLLFMMGNDANRFTQGPDTIFRVKCKCDYYYTAENNYWGGYWGWGWFRWWWGWWWPRFKKVYYISVDMNSLDLMYDNLQAELFTNKYLSGHDIPLHLKMNKLRFKNIEYKEDVLVKFTDSYHDTVTSYRYARHTGWGWWGGWGYRNYYNWYYNWRHGWNYWWGGGYYWGCPFHWWIDPVAWSSVAEQGISGIGILSDIQGFYTDVEDVFIPNMTLTYTDYANLPEAAKNVALENLPFKVHSSPYNENDYKEPNSYQDYGYRICAHRRYGNYYSYNYYNGWGGYYGYNYGYNYYGYGYYGYYNNYNYYNRGYYGWGYGYGYPGSYGWGNVWGYNYWGYGYGYYNGYYGYYSNYGLNQYQTNPVTYYEQKDMDRGLKNALMRLYTRGLFMHELQDGHPYTFMSLDVPFRNFLSVLQTQIPYLKIFKDAVIDTLDYEVLHNSLLKCIDKCVTKANGMLPDGTITQADKEHALYNYWTEMAIKFFGTKSTFMPTKDRLKDVITSRITRFENAIDFLGELCTRQSIGKWTFNEICSCFDILREMYNDSKYQEMDKFMFAYLNILYNYRLYFVNKRMNKEDGTMWIMRQLESILDFIVPFHGTNSPPPPPSRMESKLTTYKVAFYELQNTTSMKQSSIINGEQLDEDRIKTIYVRVVWTDKKAYDNWIAYRDDPANNHEVDEVIIIKTPAGVQKYAMKPKDGSFQLNSNEYIDNDRNKKWNEAHPTARQRPIQDYDECRFPITWGDSPELTPIRWNVFGTININGLLEYSKESVSPEELICLIEEGSDFWTIKIPPKSEVVNGKTVPITSANWPRNPGYRTNLKIKKLEQTVDSSISSDAYVTLLGPMAYSVYPITAKQDGGIAPGLDGETMESFKQLLVNVDGYR